MAEMPVYKLRSGDRVIVKGTIQTVKRVDFASKDDYVVRLRAHPPINARWDAMIDVPNGGQP